MPKYPTDDPDYRILARQRSRYTHYYFYIRDPVLGPMAMCAGSFLPFSMTFYINGHHFIERELLGQGVGFRKDDNAFLAVSDSEALQAAADRLSAIVIRQRLNHWSLALGPKFSQKERCAINLNRQFSIQQVEYCRNFIFHRHFPIHKLFERSCDIGLFRREGASRLEFGAPEVLVSADALTDVVGSYAVTADGERFLVKMRVEEDVTQRIHVVTNWSSPIE